MGKEYRKQYMKLWRKENPSYYIDSKKPIYAKFYRLKQGSPCFDCKSFFPYYVMEFDHRDPKTKFKNVSALVTYQNDIFIEEIAKCDLVCGNCHNIRTAGRKPARKKEPANWDYYIQSKQLPCMDCKISYSHTVVEFDHRAPSTKVMQVSELVWRGTLDALKKEIAKCDILCRNCHRIHTHKMFDCKDGCICLMKI